jgi:two-component system chemotaxis sensor kinase CheA
LSDSNVFAELQDEFINEALFLLEQYEQSLLTLETQESKNETMSLIFRVAHSVKGGAAAVGLKEVSVYSHAVEDLLSILRVYPDLVSADVISVLLKSGDIMRSWLIQIKSTGNLEFDWAENASAVKVFTEKFESIKALPLADHGGSTSIESVQSMDSKNEFSEFSQSENPSAMKESQTTNKVAEPATADGNQGRKSKSSIKVDSDRIDGVLDVVGEIVVLKNQLIHDSLIISKNDPKVHAVIDQLDKSIRDLYEKTLGLRMTPLKSLFLKTQRIVRDISNNLNKPVNLILKGENTEVERSVFDLVGDPLVHIVRNSMDHGIENKSDRMTNKKPETAQITIEASQTGSNVVIEITDDGKGIDRDKVIKKALEKGLINQSKADGASDEEIFKLIFAPGFSTADKVTDLSGRGVGLDVVRTNIEAINGKIEIQSQTGKGTKVKMIIPLSTAILDGILIGLNKQKFLIPIFSIKELIRLNQVQVTSVNHRDQFVRLREQLIPVLDLGIFEHDVDFKDRNSMLVVVQANNHQFGIPVDSIYGQTQVVVKPITSDRTKAHFSGAAVLGDGTTVLILDIQGLVQNRSQNFQQQGVSA